MNSNRQMKILINTSDFRSKGGVANYYGNLNNKFKNKVDYHYVGGHKNTNYFYVKKIKNYLKFIFKIIKYNPHIVHLNPSLDNTSCLRDVIYLIISKAFNKKVLIFWHGWKLNTEKKIDDKLNKSFRAIFNRADAFCVLSHDFKEKLIQWGITKPIYIESTHVQDELLEDFNINLKKYEELTLLFLSRIKEDKGIFILLETFKILARRHNIKLIIAGDGPDLHKMKEFVNVNNLKDIDFVGYVTGKRKLEMLSKSNIFFYPTFYGEGMPTCVLEAMAFGNCIISRPVGGIKDFFINEKMGYITDSLEPYDFAEIIKKLVLNPEKLVEISNFNHIFAKKYFMSSKVASRMENIYRKISVAQEKPYDREFETQERDKWYE